MLSGKARANESFIDLPVGTIQVLTAFRGLPLATVPLLGQSLLEHLVSHLAASGHKEILILADTRPEAVHAVVGGGDRWGVVTVINESRELSPAQALLKDERELNPNALQNGIAVVDYFPGHPELPLFTNYADCYNALLAWMPQAMTPDRIEEELRPGIWVGLHSQAARCSTHWALLDR